jgi:cation diffusion facilitator CzcD-associated flavoprotein CzcO
MNKTVYDVIIIGAGQAGLSTAYFLNRSNLNTLILDAGLEAGGSWANTWDSLKLFSPTTYSALPGYAIKNTNAEYPTAKEMALYFKAYEKYYNFNIKRPVQVTKIEKKQDHFLIHSHEGSWRTRFVVHATGNWQNPYIPNYIGREDFQGLQMHSAQYKNPTHFLDKKTLVIGGGNSGAQIASELLNFTQTTWVTLEEPMFLPEGVDGRTLLDIATKHWQGYQTGVIMEKPIGTLKDIVMVDSVRNAKAKNLLQAVRPFKKFTKKGVIWQDEYEEYFDAVVWCTGFSPALTYLQQSLNLLEKDGTVFVKGTRSIKEQSFWFVGYGDWTGLLSATLLGVTRYAKETATEIIATYNIAH